MTTPPHVPGYDVLHPLGAGGTGQVWAVRDRDGVRLAAKFIDAIDGGNDVLRHEASLLQALRHEHVVRLHEVVPVVNGGAIVVMQLAEGGSLSDALRTRDHLTTGELVTVLCPIARALHDLHSMGLVHADLSPGNIPFTQEGKPLIADLGFSHLAGDDDVPLWVTESWAAPEVLAGQEATPASDAYSLGAIAWTALVGAPPEPAALRADLVDLAPRLPSELRELVLSCLSHTPSARPSAEDFAVALWQIAPATPAPVQGSTGRRAATDSEADDLGVQLTRRIREEAQQGSGDPDGALAERAGVGRHSAPPIDSGGWWRRPVAVRTAGAAMFVGLVAGGLMLVGNNSPAGADRARPADSPAAPSATSLQWTSTHPTSSGSSSVPRSNPARSPTTTATSQVASVTARQRLARAPVAVLQRLVDARAKAWTTGNVADLRAAVRAQSAAYRADSSDLRTAQASGTTYSRLSFRVRLAHVATSGAGVVHVLAVIDRSAYSISGPGGTRTMPAGAGERTDVSLVWTSSGWRISGWDAP